MVKTRPPSLAARSSQHYPAQGGSDLVVYPLGAGSVRDGVAVGDLWFPGRDVPGDTAGLRFALFAVPFDHADVDGIRLVTEDDAGNRAEVAFVDRLIERPPSSDTIRLNDAFLERVVPEVLAQSGLPDSGDRLADYLEINGELRRRNADRLPSWRRARRPSRCGGGRSSPLPNSQVMSPFADRRTYVYDGREVDRQVHLGYDLASVRRAEVPAANDGRVVLARYFGIYGNAVVVDHGAGLMSLYGHLSSIAVARGRRGGARRDAGPDRRHRPGRRRPPALHDADRRRAGGCRASGGIRAGSRPASPAGSAPASPSSVGRAAHDRRETQEAAQARRRLARGARADLGLSPPSPARPRAAGDQPAGGHGAAGQHQVPDRRRDRQGPERAAALDRRSPWAAPPSSRPAPRSR